MCLLSLQPERYASKERKMSLCKINVIVQKEGKLNA